jgi:hypothetical protein
MVFSLQSYPSTVAQFLTKTLEDEDQSRRASCSTVRSNTGSNNSFFFCCCCRTSLLFVFNTHSSNYLCVDVVIPLFYLEYNLRRDSTGPSGQTPPKQFDIPAHLRMSSQPLSPDSTDETDEKHPGN